MARKYTEALLSDAVRASTSIAGVLRYLGVRPAGGSHAHVSRRIKEYGIDTSHFTGRGSNRGAAHKGGPRKLPWQEVLVRRTTGKRQKAFRLRRALIEMGRPYRCEAEGCGLGGEWQGKPLTLQVDHLDGDWRNDLPENLAFRCPNCHSQTKGWCGSQGLTDTTHVARQDRARRSRNGGTVDTPGLGPGAFKA